MSDRPLSQRIKPTLARIAALGGSYFRHPRYFGCIGHWFMGEGGGTRLHDITQIGSNHGVLTDADTTQAWSKGQFGVALDLDGTNDHVILDGAPLNGTEHKLSWTIMGWFNAETIPTSNKIIYESGDSDWSIIRVNVIETGGNKKLRVFNRDNNPGSEGFTFDTVTNIVAGIWYHWALTYDGIGNWKLYLNGIEDNTHSKNISGTYNMNGAAIGARPPGVSGGNESFEGFQDDFRIYNRAVDSNDILSIFLEPFLEFDPDQGDAEQPLSSLLSIVTPDPVVATWSVVTPSVSSVNLARDLIAFWKLGEADGATRVDSAGSNNLADNATVTQIAGKVGNAAHFTRASSQYLSIADNTALSMGDIDFTLSTWVYLDTKPDWMNLMGKWKVGSVEYALYYDNPADRFAFYVSDDGVASDNIPADTLGSPSTGTWIFIVCWHDSVANTLNIQINNGAIDSKAYTAGVFDSTSAFQLGAKDGVLDLLDGRLDAAGVWKKVLTSGERTKLYNSGNGLEYPFGIVTSDPVSATWSVNTPVVSSVNLARDLKAFWKLDEVSGTRVDSVGSNDLADNNTVTQADGKLGKAAQFVKAQLESLSIPDNIDLSSGDVDFSYAGWVYFDSLPSGGDAAALVHKYKSSTAQREFGIAYDGTAGRLQFYVSDDGTSGAHLSLVSADNFGAASTGVWIFIVVWHDSVNNTINIQINNGTVDSLIHTTGVFDGTQDFELGVINAAGFLDGRLDAWGHWKKVLTSSERTKLYNNGNGLEYSFGIVTPDPVSANWSVVTPVVAEAGQVTTPDPVSANWSVVTTTIAVGAVTLTPDLVSATWLVVIPNASIIVILTPDSIVANWSVVTPTVTVGTATLIPSSVVANWSVVTLTIVVGAVTLTSDLVSATWLVVTPHASIIVTLTPTSIVANWSVVTPTVTVGTATLIPSPVVVTWAVGSLILTPSSVVVTWLVAIPNVSIGIISTPTSVVITHIVVEPYIVESLFTRIRPKTARQRIRPVIPNERRRPRF